LFSAVTSAFIIDVQSDLKPDYNEMNHTLLKIVASAALGNIPTGSDAAFPVWNGPDSSVVRVQAILYASLSASLLASFVAVLGKQWLSRYSSVDHGSIIDRGRQRKRKMDGMVTWQFILVMECLPLMLQVALLLLGFALSDYLFSSINKVVAGVLIGFTAFGVLFYLLIVAAALFSYNCPFQTPIPLIFRFLIRFDKEHKKYLKRFREWFRSSFSKMKRRMHRRSGGPDGNAPGEHIALLAPTPHDQPTLLPNKGADWYGYLLDSNCITWMFEMPMDVDVTMAIARVIPEIVWHSGIRATPLEKVYNTFLQCFGHSSERKESREKLYLCAKALLHMGIQQKCIGSESGNVVFQSISDRHRTVGSINCGKDWDLKSTLCMIDHVFNILTPMEWDHLSLKVLHHTWMGHILLYRAWDGIEENNSLPDDVKGFILHSLRLVPPPPAPIVADCLFMVGFVLGIKLNHDDLSVVDKRWVDFARVFFDMKLNPPVTVPGSTFRSTGSTRSSSRRLGNPLPPLTKSTVL
jgi:hypothetical protein